MTPFVSVTLDTRAVMASLNTARARLDREIHAGMGRTVEVAAAFAKQSPLFRSHTYGLRASIRGFVIGGMGGVVGAGGGPQGRIQASAPYAGFVEFGTKPHVIRARRKKFLRFEQGGAIRFARQVYHPGTSPRPFMQFAAKRAEPVFERQMAEAVKRALEG